MKDNYIYATPYRIHQADDMYHFNSDSEFLGRMVQIQKGDRVLDVGTNNGYLLFYASLYTDQLYGIDIFEKAIRLAQANMERNHLKAFLRVARLQDYQEEPFDVILVNPPYFTSQNETLKKLNPYLKAARHDDTLPLKDLFFHTYRLLKEDGSLQMVHRADSFALIQQEAKRAGFEVVGYRYCMHKGVKKSCVYFLSKQYKPIKEYSSADSLDRDTFVYKGTITL